jgi:hypothetical protein
MQEGCAAVTSDTTEIFALKIVRPVRARALLRKAKDRCKKSTRHDECLALDRATAEESAAWEEMRAAVADIPADQVPHVTAALRNVLRLVTKEKEICYSGTVARK